MLLRKGDKGDNVKCLQQGLTIMCLDPKGIDGSFGPGTEEAVKRFQTRYSLTVDGIVGDETWNVLVDCIIPIQQALINKGYSLGVPDGVAGPVTYNGVLDFQRKNGLTADGMVGTLTREKLFSTSTSINSASVISKGSTGASVKEIQSRLNSLGYSCGSIGADGVFGNATYQAVVTFQKNNGLEMDGIVGENTVKALNSSSAVKYTAVSVLKKGCVGVDVVTLQNRLIYLGYSCGLAGADGIFGDCTYQAVILFQNINGLGVDGIVDEKTWSVINSSSAKNNTTSSPVSSVPTGYTTTIEEFVNTALGELGYVEGSNNNTKYGNWYGMNYQPWCAMFVSWCGKESGILQNTANPNGLVPLYASVYLGMQWYQNKGRFGVKKTYKPHYGDILFLKSSGASHTAIVIGYDEGSNTLCTIEGNFSDKVAIVRRYADDGRITGYGINGSDSYGVILENAILDKGVHSTL